MSHWHTANSIASIGCATSKSRSVAMLGSQLCWSPTVVDDIARIATCTRSVQDILDIVTEYANTWRFAPNPSKRQVMGEYMIVQGGAYAYLGVSIVSNLRSKNI
jgi:hypothetical protein